MQSFKDKLYRLLRWSEKYAKTDMVYLASGGFWLNLSTATMTGFSLLLYIAFAKLLPKESYGIYQFALSLASTLGALTLTGMNTAITQAVARKFEGSFKKSIITQLSWGIIPFLAAVGISIYYFLNSNNNLALAVLIVGIFLPILNSFNTYAAFLSGKKDFKKSFLYSQITNFAFYPIMIGSLFLTKNPLILIGINFAVNTIIAIFLYILTVRFYKPNTEEDPDTLPFAKHLSLMNIVGLIATQADNLLVFHYIGAAELAIYIFATNIPDRFNSLIKNITSVALPKLSEKTRAQIKSAVLNKSFKLALFTALSSVLYIIAAPFIYKIFFPEYLQSVRYSQIYSLVLIIGSLSNLPMAGIMASKAKKELYIFNFIQPISAILIMFIGIINYGIWGLIIARGFSNLISFIILAILISRKQFLIEA